MFGEGMRKLGGCQRKNIRLFELLVCPLCSAAALGRRGAAPVCLGLCAPRRRCIVKGIRGFLSEYASFLAKTLTLVVAIVVVLVAIAATRGRGRRGSGQLQVQKLNDFYKDLRERLEHSVLSKDQLKATRKAQAKAAKQERKRRRANRGCSCWISTVISRPQPPTTCAMK